MFCYFMRSSSSWVFWLRFTFKLLFVLGFEHGSGTSVKAIMQLLPLAIGLRCFWFLIVLFLYLKSTILGSSFLDLKDLCLPNQFSRGSWRSFQYILNLMSKKELGSLNDLIINTYFQSFICLPRYRMNIFCPVSFVKFPWHYWTELSQSLTDLMKTLRSHGNLKSLTDLTNGANIGTHSNSRYWLFLMFMMSKMNPFYEQEHAILETFLSTILYLRKT